MTTAAPGATSRRGVLTLLGAPALWALPGLATAGAQIEEPLADAVRNAMSMAVGSSEPPEPVFATTEARVQYVRWKVEMNQRLVGRKSDLRTLQQRDEFLQTLWYDCKRARLDVAMVLGLIQVESNFRQFCVSSAGARGYMQVMPFWSRSIGDGDASKLFQMKLNLRFGCAILRLYMDMERNDAFMALGRYNGSRGKAPYPDAVLGARKRWEFTA
jgi:soluble lytic murein transglycosylase-like protein